MTKRRALYTFTFAALSAATADASTWDISASLERFDRNIAPGIDTDIVGRFDSLARGSLPAAIGIPTLDHTGTRHVAMLVVRSRLRGSVTFPGDSAATLYDAMLDGKVAVVTRSDEALDISVVTADGVDVVTVGTDAPTMGHAHHVPAVRTARGGEGPPRRRRSVTYGFDGDGGQASEPPVTMEMADPLAPLEIRLFLHDDLPASRARTIHSDYVAWWLRDMASNILPPDVSINVFTYRPFPASVTSRTARPPR